jgi:outer membrane protein assembly factor BamB
MPTPIVKPDAIYGICSYGELRALNPANGQRLWMTMKATRGALTAAKAKNEEGPTAGERWSNAFLIEHGNRTVIFNEQGDLIFAELTKEGYRELSRAHIIDATNPLARRMTVWTHPAFAHQCCFVRNDREIICVDLAKK